MVFVRAFQVDQKLFGIKSSCIAGQFAACAYHSMTWDKNAYSVGSVSIRNGSNSLWYSEQFCQLKI